MTQALLTRHPLIATRDLDRAREEVAQRFCPHRLAPTRAGAAVDVVHNAAVVGGHSSVHYLRYGDEVRITPGRFEDFYLVQVPLAGRAQVSVGGEVVASDRRYGSLGSPTEPVDMVWADGCEQLLVYLSRAVVEQAAATAYGTTGPVVFAPRVDLATAGLRAWMRLVRLVVDDLETGGALVASPLAALHLEQTLVAGLLAAQPHDAAPAAVPEPTPVPCAVRRVRDAVQADPAAAWTLAGLADTAGVSARTLQAAFRDDLGTTPMEYLRRVRLDRARHDLVAADPATTSVTDVATRWGFVHLGRFAQRYAATFAELPSTTLAR